MCGQQYRHEWDRHRSMSVPEQHPGLPQSFLHPGNNRGRDGNGSGDLQRNRHLRRRRDDKLCSLQQVYRDHSVRHFLRDERRLRRCAVQHPDASLW